MRLTKKQQAALDYFNLDYARSDEPGAGWFAYTKWQSKPSKDYPGSSCEDLSDVVRWYEAATTTFTLREVIEVAGATAADLTNEIPDNEPGKLQAAEMIKLVLQVFGERMAEAAIKKLDR